MISRCVLVFILLLLLVIASEQQDATELGLVTMTKE